MDGQNFMQEPLEELSELFDMRPICAEELRLRDERLEQLEQLVKHCFDRIQKMEASNSNILHLLHDWPSTAAPYPTTPNLTTDTLPRFLGDFNGSLGKSNSCFMRIRRVDRGHGPL